MKKIGLPFIIKCTLFSKVMVSAWIVLAQPSTNLSGKWFFNEPKSKAEEGSSFAGSEVTLDIIQDQSSMKITRTNKNKGGVVDTTLEECLLDAKEKVIKEDSNGISIITKKSCKWSADKRQIILNESVSMSSSTYTHEDVYSLSNNERTLTIHSSRSMNARKGTEILVYDKR